MRKEFLNLVKEKWNSIGVSEIISINKNTSRYKMLNKRIEEYGEDDVLKAIENVPQSDFLLGSTGKWTITFDWFVRPNNFIKVLEGYYLEREKEIGKINKEIELEATEIERERKKERIERTPIFYKKTDGEKIIKFKNIEEIFPKSLIRSLKKDLEKIKNDYIEEKQLINKAMEENKNEIKKIEFIYDMLNNFREEKDDTNISYWK